MKTNALIFAGTVITALATPQTQAYTCSAATGSRVPVPPSITIPRDLPVGSPIGSEVVSGVVQAFSCSDTPPPSLTYQQFGVRAYGDYVATFERRRIYSTNIAGVGYAVGATLVNTCPLTGYVTGLTTGDGIPDTRLICNSGGIFSNQPLEAKAVIQFYKTANVTGTGRVTSRQAGSFILLNDRTSWVQPESRISFSPFNIKTTACTVDNTAVSVPMGTVEKRAFEGVGSWTGDENTRSFTIPLDCNAGIKVRVKIDGSAQNASLGVLNLSDGNDSASGVGIQLLYNGSPLKLGEKIDTGMTNSEGAYSTPLQARYYQTGSSIIPGRADAGATFELTYQ